MLGMSPRARSTKRADQARRTREQIVAAALRLFAERGYDGSSLQAIADESGLTKAAVYYHFRTKDEILRAVLVPAQDAGAALAATAYLDLPRPEKLDLLIGGFVELLLSHRELLSIVNVDPAMRFAHAKLKEPFEERNSQMVFQVFGEHPTNRERAAFYATSYLGEIVPHLEDVDAAELRDILTDLAYRIIGRPEPS
jgi:AcrR family transcriptional regulator